MAQSNLKRQNPPLNIRVPCSRSLSQATFFGNSLPPLSPFPPSESLRASSNSSLKDASMEEMDVSSRGSMFLPFPRENIFRANDSLPPRSGHRRANSDSPFGYPAVIQSSPQLVSVGSQGILGRMGIVKEEYSENQKPVGLKKGEMYALNYGKSGVQGVMGEKKSDGEVVSNLVRPVMNMDRVDVFNSSFSLDKDKGSNMESKSVSRYGKDSREGVKRCAVGDIAPPTRHYRSLSVDSAIENIYLGDKSPKLPTNQVDQLLPGNSASEISPKLNLDLGHGEFNELELKKIMSDERLGEIAVSDPKRAKRILANRQSAARSKERKVRYISELEHKVQSLQTDATSLSAQVTILQKCYTELNNENNELKIRLQAMDQQVQLKDALHEALITEIQRLKFENLGLRDEGQSSDGMAPFKRHMFPMQHQQPNQMQRLSSKNPGPSSAAGTSA